MDFTPGVDPGGGGCRGRGSRPIWKILGGKHIVLPSPPPPIISSTEKFIICNARIGFKSTVRHYKTIKFNIKTLLNINSFSYATLRKCASFLTLAPPPPPIRKMDRRPDSWRTPGLYLAYLYVWTYKWHLENLGGGGGGLSAQHPPRTLWSLTLEMLF